MGQPADLSAEEFRALGHQVVDALAEFYASLPSRPPGPNVTVDQLRDMLGSVPFPEEGTEPAGLLRETLDLLLPNSVYNAHPRFFGFITPSAAPLGALADLIAAGLNQNVASFLLAPMATEIEVQTIGWLARMIGFPKDCGGILVSGGTMANLIAVHVARRVKCPWDVRADGLSGAERLVAYTTTEVHNWVEVAAELTGLGTASIRWLPVDADQRMDLTALRSAIAQDRANGAIPFLIVASAGTTSTGAIDPLVEIRDIARAENMWFHVDGAYGAPAAMLPDASPDLMALADADSVALDPHKWLYAPIEAGCVLVRERAALKETFSRQSPAYYRIKRATGERRRAESINFIQYGPQATRGFRALKVWLTLRHVGRAGYVAMLTENVRLARLAYDRAAAHPNFEALSHSLSITNLRFVPPGLTGEEEYLNKLNAEIVTRVRVGGQAYVTPGHVGHRVTIRIAVVNFRTAESDIEALIELCDAVGADLHSAYEPPAPVALDDDMATRLASVALFRRIPPDGVAALARGAAEQTYPAGEALMREGEVSDCLHVVVSGRARVEQTQDEESVLVINQVGPGDLVGEMGVLDDEPRSATVIATEDMTTIRISADAVAAAIEAYPQLAAAMLPTLSRRLRRAEELARRHLHPMA